MALFRSLASRFSSTRLWHRNPPVRTEVIRLGRGRGGSTEHVSRVVAVAGRTMMRCEVQRWPTSQPCRLHCHRNLQRGSPTKLWLRRYSERMAETLRVPYCVSACWISKAGKNEPKGSFLSLSLDRERSLCYYCITFATTCTSLLHVGVCTQVADLQVGGC